MPAVTDNNKTSCVIRITHYVLLLTLLTACTVVRLTRPAVKIGLVGPFEGQYRYVGYDAIYAARLALRQANAAGGVARRAGYSVELVAYDDQGTIIGAHMAARNLAQDPDVVAVVGHFRDETTGAAQALYDEAGLPLIVAGTVEGEAGVAVGRLEVDGQADLLCLLLDYLGDELDSRRVQWMPATESNLACTDGLAVTVGAEVPPAPAVDSVLLTLDPMAAGETLVALRDAGWDGVVAGGPALGSPLFTQAAGTAVAGVVFVSPYRWPDTDHQDAAFSAAYQSVGPHVPRPGPFALTTYESIQALLAAIESATGQGETLTRQALLAHLALPPTTTVYLYRWTSLGVLELVKEAVSDE